MTSTSRTTSKTIRTYGRQAQRVIKPTRHHLFDDEHDKHAEYETPFTSPQTHINSNPASNPASPSQSPPITKTSTKYARPNLEFHRGIKNHNENDVPALVGVSRARQSNADSEFKGGRAGGNPRNGAVHAVGDDDANAEIGTGPVEPIGGAVRRSRRLTMLRLEEAQPRINDILPERKRGEGKRGRLIQPLRRKEQGKGRSRSPAVAKPVGGGPVRTVTTATKQGGAVRGSNVGNKGDADLWSVKENVRPSGLGGKPRKSVARMGSAGGGTPLQMRSVNVNIASKWEGKGKEDRSGGKVWKNEEVDGKKVQCAVREQRLGMGRRASGVVARKEVNEVVMVPETPFVSMGGKRKKQPQRESVVDKGEICESLGEAVQVESLSVCESNETIGKKVTVQDLLVFCPAKKVTPFRDLIRERKWKDITKIGEATFSEVFHALDHSNNKQTEPVAIKVIPFGRPEIVINDSAQLTVETVYKEILITSILNELSVNSGMKGGGLNFVKLKSVAICSGPYPKELLNSWDTWDSENESENDRPDILPSDQLYAVLILEDGGNDLEHVLLNTWKQVRSLFAQIAVSLAVAEKKLNFEHRDLHWGNVLVAPTKVQVLSYQMGERLVKVQTGGIRVSLIDFTLSRLEKDGQVHSFPFDNSFFEGEGELHFDVYRIMRKILNDEWHRFEPVTNFQWLHYLTRQVVVGKCVPQSTSQEARRQKEKLKAFGNRLMGVVISRGDRGSGSGMESVLTDEYLSSIVEVVAD